MRAVSVYVGGRIEDFRKEKGITQAALAEIIDRSRASVINIENGRQNTPLHIVIEITIALGVSIVDLIPTKEWYVKNKNKEIRKVVTYEIID